MVAIGPGEVTSKRVAVGRRASHVGGADVAGGAADILHDHRLPPFAAELVGDEPRQHIGAAAGGVGHDDAHRRSETHSAQGLHRSPMRRRPSARYQTDMIGRIVVPALENCA